MFVNLAQQFYLMFIEDFRNRISFLLVTCLYQFKYRSSLVGQMMRSNVTFSRINSLGCSFKSLKERLKSTIQMVAIQLITLRPDGAGFVRDKISRLIVTVVANVSTSMEPSEPENLSTWFTTWRIRSTLNRLNVYVGSYWKSTLEKPYISSVTMPDIIVVDGYKSGQKPANWICAFFPAYSPNLNLIERLWRLLRKEAIDSCYYPDYEDFRKGITGFLDNTKLYKEEIRSLLTINFRTVGKSSYHFSQTTSWRV